MLFKQRTFRGLVQTSEKKMKKRSRFKRNNMQMIQKAVVYFSIAESEGASMQKGVDYRPGS